MQAPPLSEEELNAIYNWVDEIPLSRPKKNIARDFADGVLMAEIVHHYIPRIVEIHNYSPAHSTSAKLYNWNTLNQKVFKKMGFQLNKTDIDAVINCVPEAIERVLKVLQIKIEKYLEEKERGDTSINQPQHKIHQAGPGVMDPRYQQQYDPRMIQNQGVDPNLIAAKDQAIQDLKETIEILELKINKLEQLVKLKDSKIQTLQNKLAQAGIV